MSENFVTPQKPHDPFVVPPERREAIYRWIENKVDRYGIEVPAVFMLEMMKPLSFVLSQLMLVGAPVLYPVFGMDRTENLAQLLSERENVEELICRIERRAAGEETQALDSTQSAEVEKTA